MNSIQFLKDSNFTVDHSGILNVNITGYSLILFYSTQCPHCKEMMEAVKHMPQIINGCSFGIINLDENKGVIQKCAKSQLKLKYVPFLVFFANGVPYMVYNGPTDENEIKRFIVQVSDAYVKEFQTTMPAAPSQMTQHGRPGQGGSAMGGRGMGGAGINQGDRSQTGMQSSRSQAAKPNLDLACSLDDMACLEHSVKKYSGCYVSMQDAYTNKIGK